MSKTVPELPLEERVLVTVEVAAAMLSISRSLAYELVSSGDLPFIRIGPAGLIRVSPDALRRWVDGFDFVSPVRSASLMTDWASPTHSSVG